MHILLLYQVTFFYQEQVPALDVQQAAMHLPSVRQAFLNRLSSL